MPDSDLPPAAELEELISATGRSKREFARDAGISHSHLYFVLKGERAPSPRMAARIRKALAGGEASSAVSKADPSPRTVHLDEAEDGRVPIPAREAARDLASSGTRLMLAATAGTHEAVARRLVSRAEEHLAGSETGMELLRVARQNFRDASSLYRAAGDEERQLECTQSADRVSLRLGRHEVAEVTAGIRAPDPGQVLAALAAQRAAESSEVALAGSPKNRRAEVLWVISAERFAETGLVEDSNRCAAKAASAEAPFPILSADLSEPSLKYSLAREAETRARLLEAVDKPLSETWYLLAEDRYARGHWKAEARRCRLRRNELIDFGVTPSIVSIRATDPLSHVTRDSVLSDQARSMIESAHAARLGGQGGRHQ